MYEVIENVYDSEDGGKGTVRPVQRVVKREPKHGKAQALADKLNDEQSLISNPIRVYYVQKA